MAEAVRQVVGAHPGLAVTVQVEHAGRTYPMRVPGTAQRHGRTGAPADAGGTPAGLAALRPDVPAWAPGPDGAPDPAARLAELIRRDPTLLDELDPRR